MKSIFIDTTATREFSLSFDSDKSVIWTLGSLDSRIILHIMSKYLNPLDSPDVGRFFAQLVELVRFGLRGVKGLTDKDGNSVNVEFEEVDVPYVGKRTAVTDAFLSRLSTDTLIELGQAVRSDNILTEDERKKSSGR